MKDLASRPCYSTSFSKEFDHYDIFTFYWVVHYYQTYWIMISFSWTVLILILSCLPSVSCGHLWTFGRKSHGIQPSVFLDCEVSRMDLWWWWRIPCQPPCPCSDPRWLFYIFRRLPRTSKHSSEWNQAGFCSSSLSLRCSHPWGWFWTCSTLETARSQSTLIACIRNVVCLWWWHGCQVWAWPSWTWWDSEWAWGSYRMMRCKTSRWGLDSFPKVWPKDLRFWSILRWHRHWGTWSWWYLRYCWWWYQSLARICHASW